jgi:excisionase family DNA binding protein
MREALIGRAPQTAWRTHAWHRRGVFMLSETKPMPTDANSDPVEVFDQYLTVSEIAKTLRLNEQTVRNMIDRGELRAVRVGARRVRVLRADLDAFLPDQDDQMAQLTTGRRESFDNRLADLQDQIRGLRARIEDLERAATN